MRSFVISCWIHRRRNVFGIGVPQGMEGWGKKMNRGMGYRKTGWLRNLLCSAAVCLLCAGMWDVDMPFFPAAGEIVANAAQNSLNRTELTISKGERFALSVKGSYKKIFWSAGNKKIATVSEKGVVKGVSAGKTVVTAEVDGTKYQCKVTVESPSLNKTKVNAEMGDTYQLKVSGTKRKVSYKSSDTSIVKVSSKGKLSFLKPGSASVTATVGSSKLTCTVKVKNSLPAAVKTDYYEGLSEQDGEVAKKAREVLDSVVREGMEDIEKVLALHDYIVLHTAYDTSYTKYSVKNTLLDGSAVCQGYADTMKLFLDVLGIENQLIYGVAGGDHHVWNLVCLDGQWYHLDVTWDDPLLDGKDVPGEVCYEYFMVADGNMAKDHSWERADYPLAEGGIYTGYIWDKLMEEAEAAGLFAATKEEFSRIVTGTASEGEREVAILCKGTSADAETFLSCAMDALMRANPGREIRVSYRMEAAGAYTRIWLGMEFR